MSVKKHNFTHKNWKIGLCTVKKINKIFFFREKWGVISHGLFVHYSRRLQMFLEIIDFLFIVERSQLFGFSRHRNHPIQIKAGNHMVAKMLSNIVFDVRSIWSWFLYE